ncbi:MAG: nucleotidyltransferase family protein, partial [Selenomonas sp.]|nr:nucleotidyltransferase family protein [Selenomonas sp.]
MQVTGIIAEYNPFHNGHLYQINKIRTQSDARIIAVMSGSFTQRGEATLLDKWERARLAVLCGCDLVLELPFVFACRSAQDFARGGVTLLSRLGIVDTLAFGAEHDDITALTELAAELDQ